MAKKAPPSIDIGEADARQEVLDTALAMSRRGLSPGRSGNVSRRWAGGMLITPTGLDYDSLVPADIVFVAADGTAPAGQKKPSSEAPFHLAIYRARPDCHAIVHTHSLHATVLACARKSIPAFHYMVAVAGGTDIPCVPYATFGSAEISRHVAEGLKHRDACLMANHGATAIGVSCAAAIDLASEVENLAEQYCKLLMLGKPIILDDAKMQIVLAKFKTYGQNAQKPRGL